MCCSTRGYGQLNDSAAEILKQVDGQRSVNEIIAELQASFPSASSWMQTFWPYQEAQTTLDRFR